MGLPPKNKKSRRCPSLGISRHHLLVWGHRDPRGLGTDTSAPALFWGSSRLWGRFCSDPGWAWVRANHPGNNSANSSKDFKMHFCENLGAKPVGGRVF